MDEERRNPYVLLGVPYGSPRDVATAAFARRARHLRRDPSREDELTSLTWALNQVSEELGDPTVVLHVYRVPADPAALEANLSPGLLNPPPVRLDRRTVASPDDQARALDEALASGVEMALAELIAAAPMPAR
jgi:hypothetical protein